MEAAVQAQGEALVKQVKGIIVYDIGGVVYTWVVPRLVALRNHPGAVAFLPRLCRLNLKEGSGSLSKGKVGTPDVTITVTDKIFLQLGELPVRTECWPCG